MKFSCDQCHAQYMISDDKVGPAGVRVRCKKCQNVVLVKRTEPEEPPPEDATVVMTAEKMAQMAASGIGLPMAPDAPPKPTDDEIGQAFDSMFPDGSGSPSPPVAPPPGPPLEDPDRAETRVFSSNDIARIASELGGIGGAKLSDPGDDATEVGKASPATPPAPEPPAEWFVAVREEQVGPLGLEGVKEKWEKGEVGPDTLVWSAGMADWRPLSAVPELAKLVSPAPAAGRPHAVEPAPAQSFTSEPTKPQRSLGGDESDFKPSAASALASLASMAQEEMAQAEQRQAAPPEPAPSRGSLDLLGDLPPAPAPALRPVAPRESFGDDSGSPDSARAAPARRQPLAQDPYPPAAAFSSRPVFAPAGPPWRLIALAGGGVLALLLVVGLLVWALVVKPRQQEDERLNALTAQLAAQRTAPPPAPAAPPPPVVAANAVAPAVPGTAAPAPAPAAAPPPAAAAPTPAPASAPSRVAADEGSRRGKGHGRHRERERAAPSAAPAASAPVAAAAPAPSSGGDDFLGGAGDSNIDKEFAKELDGSGDSAASNKRGGSRHSVYIPPPPGQSDLPSSLSQSDVMQVIVEHKGSFARCVQDQKRRDPGSSGTLVMHWKIRPDGHTADVHANSGDFASSPLAGCLKGQIARLRFGGYSGAQMAPIDFPFSF